MSDAFFQALEPRRLLSAEFTMDVDPAGNASEFGMISPFTDDDTWEFKAPGTGWGVVSVRGNGFDARLRLFDKDMNPITTERSETGGVAAIQLYLVQGRTYIARVRSDGASVGTYDLAASLGIPVQNRAASRVEPDGNGDASGSFTLGDARTAGAAAATRYFRFRPLGDGETRFSLSPLEFDLDVLMVLHDNTGKVLSVQDSRGAGGEELILHTLTGGQDYVLVVSSWSGDGLARLSIDGPQGAPPPPPGPPETLGQAQRDAATRITLDGRGEGSSAGLISAGGELDVFVLTAPTTGAATIIVDPASSLDAVMVIYDASGARIGGVTDEAGKGDNERRTLSIGAGQTLYLLVAGGAGTVGAYGVGVDAADEPDLPAQERRASTGIWINHRNGNGSRRGDIQLAGERDVFRFAPAADGRVALRLVARGGFDGALDLFAADGTPLRTGIDRKGPGGAERIRLRLDAGETYYAVVRSAAPEGGNYVLRVNGAGNGGERGVRRFGGERIDDAAGVWVGGPGRTNQPGRIEARHDNDLYWFAAPAEGTVRITLTPLTRFNVVLTVLTPWGGVLHEVNDAAGKKPETIELALGEGELIYLDASSIGGRKGRYRLSIDA